MFSLKPSEFPKFTPARGLGWVADLYIELETIGEKLGSSPKLYSEKGDEYSLPVRYYVYFFELNTGAFGEFVKYEDESYIQLFLESIDDHLL